MHIEREQLIGCALKVNSRKSRIAVSWGGGIDDSKFR